MKTTKEVTIKFHWGEYKTTYLKEEVFCPNCGEKKVWSENSEGDYYIGPTYLCIGCNFAFHLPSSGETTEKAYLSVITQLRDL